MISGILQPQEGIHAFLFAERRDARMRRDRALAPSASARAASALPGSRSSVKARLRAMYSCPGYTRVASGSLRELIHEGFVEQAGIAAVVAIAGAGIEQRVAAEQRRRIAMRQQAHVRAGVPGRVEHLELDGAAHLDDVAARQAAIYAADAARGTGMRQHARARRRDDLGVAIGVIAGARGCSGPA